MQRTRLAVMAAAAAVLVAVGLGTRYSPAVAAPSAESAVYLWKDLNGKCPALCDRNVYVCPCMAATRDPAE